MKKGEKMSLESRIKLSNKIKGHFVSLETRKKISESLNGRPSLLKGRGLSKQHKINLSISHKGQKAWNKGIRRTLNIFKNCEYCGSIITKSTRYSSNQWNKIRFCSKKCRAIKLKSVNFHHFISGISIYRKIIEGYVGRKLKRNEVVHHIDGNRKNNSIKNLALMSNEEHSRLHAIQRKLGYDKKGYRKRNLKGRFM